MKELIEQLTDLRCRLSNLVDRFNKEPAGNIPVADQYRIEAMLLQSEIALVASTIGVQAALGMAEDGIEAAALSAKTAMVSGAADAVPGAADKDVSPVPPD